MKIPAPSEVTVVGGIVRREYRIPKGGIVTSHVHPYDHLSVLLSGECSLAVDGKVSVLRGPTCVEIKAGRVHTIHALTDVTWDCIHSFAEAEASGDPFILEGMS